MADPKVEKDATERRNKSAKMAFADDLPPDLPLEEGLPEEGPPTPPAEPPEAAAPTGPIEVPVESIPGAKEGDTLIVDSIVGGIITLVPGGGSPEEVPLSLPEEIPPLPPE